MNDTAATDAAALGQAAGLVDTAASVDTVGALDTEVLVDTARQNLYPNYAQPALVMDRGEGAKLFDRQGRSYLDFFAGIAVSTLGHGHPALVSALSEQAHKLIHLSNYYYNAPNIELANWLCRLTGLERAFFCNSGTEANEAALKLCRRHFFNQGMKERNVVLCFDNSFHGRTLGALTATGQQKYREGFGPIGAVIHVPYGDLNAVRDKMDASVAGILVEPIQGEGGVVEPPIGFLPGLREICDQQGALLMFDEIQTGVGRTGTFLAAEHESVRPDVVTLAKALGGGVPIGAMMCSEALSRVLPPGSHGTTFGGNPLASAAALAVLSVMESSSLLGHVAELGARLAQRLEDFVGRHRAAKLRRGRGLLQGLVLTDPTQGPLLLEALRNEGVLLTFAGGCALRFTPPLTISMTELDEGLDIVDRVLATAS